MNELGDLAGITIVLAWMAAFYWAGKCDTRDREHDWNEGITPDAGAGEVGDDPGIEQGEGR